MATITVSTEEYEEFLKLRERVKELEEEKTQILLNADKQVSIVHETVITEKLHLKKSVDDVLKTIDSCFNTYITSYLDLKPERKLQLIYDTLFDLSSTQTKETQRIEYKGFDDFKEQIRQEIQTEEKAKVQEQLDKIPYLENARESLSKQLQELTYEASKSKGQELTIRKLRDKVSDLETGLELHTEYILEYRDAIRDIIEDQKWTIFNYAEQKRQLRKIHWVEYLFKQEKQSNGTT